MTCPLCRNSGYVQIEGKVMVINGHRMHFITECPVCETGYKAWLHHRKVRATYVNPPRRCMGYRVLRGWRRG